MKDPKDPLINVVFRKERKIVHNVNLPKSAVEVLLVEAFQSDVSGALLAIPELRQGNTFKFKLSGYNITLRPLLNHSDFY